MAGFIHDKLDMKILILYLLCRVEGELDFPALTDLVMAERDAEYFLFAQSVAELTESGHIALEDNRYHITDKGRRNSAESETTLPPVVRKRYQPHLAQLNATLRLQKQVRAQVEEKENGEFLLRLALDDGNGNLFSLDLLTASREHGEQMARRFRAHPEQVYHGILSVLLDEENA